MKFIEQMKAFGEQSAGVLDAKEQAMYLRLFLIDNALGWPEWFAVSVSQLKREMNTGSHHTIVRAKRSLERHGFIQTKNDNRTGITSFKIVELVQKMPMAKNDQGKKCHRLGQKMPTSRAENAIVLGQKMPTSKDSKTIQDNKTAAATAPDQNLSEVVNLFSNNIHPISGEIELQKLADLYDGYGKDWTLAAITEAAENNGRSVRYIESILERWKRDGYKSERRNKYDRTYGGAKGVRSRAEAKPEPNYGFMEAVKNRPHPWDLPQEGGEGAGDS